MHKDVTGKDLAVGDKVVYSDGRYADLNLGYVIGFSPKNIRVADRPGDIHGCIKASSQVAKVEE